jgi:Catalytic LigB subunit of aromatic ring-opening dioxygenase
MAKIVLGMAASHGPLLATPPEMWGERAEADRRNPALVYRDGTFKFEELTKLRANENLQEQIELPVKRRRYDACQRAMAEMARVFKAAKPDVAVLIGNDQMEVFEDANIPAFMVCFGESVDNIPFSEEQKKRLPLGIAIAEANHHGKMAQTYPGHPELGRYLIEQLVQRDFDIAASARLPQSNSSSISGLPHAYGFLYRRIMQDNFVPAVPFFINTFYPPNQPSVRRCLSLGKALAQAIAGWDPELRVAIVGSGGMSHFVVDEELDRSFLAAMQRKDADALISIPPYNFRSGSSELKNWIPVAGAMHELGLDMTLVDYQPLYRSAAGTGSGMAFAYWH